METSDWHQRYQQQAQWTAALRAYLFNHAGIKPDSNLLEVGCGTGVILQQTQQLLPACELHGLDIDFASLLWTRQITPTAALVQADAHQLPYPDGQFDAVICHFLLLWVSHPVTVVREMKRITRNGGVVMAFAEPDYGGRIDYPDELSILGEQQRQSLLHQGANPLIGRSLGSIFHKAGLTQIESGVLGANWRAPLDEEAWKLEWDVLQSDLESDGNLMSELTRLKALDAKAYQEGERVLYVPTFYAWGRNHRV